MSYSFHLSSREHCISNKSVLIKASKHNNRLFEDSKDYNKELNVRLIGSNNIFNDVKQLYDDTFSESVKRHDEIKKKTKDKIGDYFEKISESTKSHLAEEIIIMIGDKEFWENRNFLSHKEELTDIFKEQVKRLQELSPNFKIANATVHYDEASPHIHIIGVPTKITPNKDLQIRVSKKNCFTKESLAMLQERLRVGVAEQVKEIFNDQQITEQEKVAGRKMSYKVAEYKWVKANENILKNKYAEHFKELENKLKEKNLKLELVDDVYTLQEQKIEENRKLEVIRKAAKQAEEEQEEMQNKNKEKQKIDQQLDAKIQEQNLNLKYIKLLVSREEKKLEETKNENNNLRNENENLTRTNTNLVSKNNEIQTEIEQRQKSYKDMFDTKLEIEIRKKTEEKVMNEVVNKQEDIIKKHIEKVFDKTNEELKYGDVYDEEIDCLNQAIYQGDAQYVNQTRVFNEYYNKIDLMTKFRLLCSVFDMLLEKIRNKNQTKNNTNSNSNSYGFGRYF